jgi:hypothetical protein
MQENSICEASVQDPSDSFSKTEPIPMCCNTFFVHIGHLSSCGKPPLRVLVCAKIELFHEFVWVAKNG